MLDRMRSTMKMWVVALLAASLWKDSTAAGVGGLAIRQSFIPFEQVYSIKEENYYKINFRCSDHFYLPGTRDHPELGKEFQVLSLARIDSMSAEEGFEHFVCSEGYIFTTVSASKFEAVGLQSDLVKCQQTGGKSPVGLELKGNLTDEGVQIHLRVKFAQDGQFADCIYLEGYFTATPTPTPTPTPAPTPTPTSTPTPSPTPSPTPTPTPSPVPVRSSVSPSPSPSPSPTAIPITDSSCFAADSEIIRVRNGQKEVVSLSELRSGDLVESFDLELRRDSLSEVAVVEHANGRIRGVVRQLSLSTGTTLQVTKSHYIVLGSGEYMVAENVMVGNELLLADGTTATIMKIHEAVKELRNVITMNDHAVVNGVVVSCYTRLFLVPFRLAQMAALPLKLLHMMRYDQATEALSSSAYRLYNFAVS
eukprot:CAMPEP_0198731748 /NCGR_PEP_ID=MMETSP1475-20131203/31889_1 /TAXON_ID= ORGANISM="Unidentified sp., Strain CCMP1999" /NCGR_SAMPLE_ID=MMETSP1475 /ASSEMBLY_ACC=CAM_ASM_001111 /LENGTH=420 /DNA_ID=CAMNT_0044494753 /DNA_START=105 /DNA_END=1364 /DNA_ORIENTATION=-